MSTHKLSIAAIDPEHLHLYAPRPCAYFKQRDEQLVNLVNPSRDRVPLDALYNSGFRRYGQEICYLSCSECNACKLLRVATDTFAPSKGQRRVARKNSDLSIHTMPSTFVQEHYDLFCEYTIQRHYNSSNPQITPEIYNYNTNFPQDSSQLLELRAPDGQLLAVCSFDITDTALMLHQSYYDLEASKTRSLGIYVVLALLDFAKTQNREYVYLGHWVSGHKKMAYKTSFRPFELLMDKIWYKIGNDT